MTIDIFLDMEPSSFILDTLENMEVCPISVSLLPKMEKHLRLKKFSLCLSAKENKSNIYLMGLFCQIPEERLY